MPQFMIIMIQVLTDNKENLDFPIESLSYTATALTAVSFNNFFNIRDRTTSSANVWLYVFGMVILMMTSLNTVFLYLTQHSYLIVKGNVSQDTITIATFILSLIFFLFADYFFYKLNYSGNLLSFQLEEEHKINLNSLAKAFISFVKSSPKMLIISTFVTIALYIIFHYESNIVNHLGVLGGVIAIFTLFDNKEKK